MLSGMKYKYSFLRNLMYRYIYKCICIHMHIYVCFNIYSYLMRLSINISLRKKNTIVGFTSFSNLFLSSFSLYQNKFLILY